MAKAHRRWSGTQLRPMIFRTNNSTLFLGPWCLILNTSNALCCKHKFSECLLLLGGYNICSGKWVSRDAESYEAVTCFVFHQVEFYYACHCFFRTWCAVVSGLGRRQNSRHEFSWCLRPCCYFFGVFENYLDCFSPVFVLCLWYRFREADIIVDNDIVLSL